MWRPSAQADDTSFHTHLNPLVAILDPERTSGSFHALSLTAVHTIDHLRTSSALFTTVLVAASKFVVSQTQHTTLLAHAESLINRATNAGECSTALVQSLLILVYYKGPTDRTAWLKIGIAIRLAYQMRWHDADPANRQLPADEHEARLVLVSIAQEGLADVQDPERTWFCKLAVHGVVVQC